MILRRFTFAYHAVVYWNAAPRGAREAGHSNILWTALLTAWCCSTLGNQHRHFRSQTIRRPNMGATRKSGRGMRKARLWVIWRGYSIFPCSGSVRLCSNGGSKMPIFPKTDERSKPARFCFDGGNECGGYREATWCHFPPWISFRTLRGFLRQSGRTETPRGKSRYRGCSRRGRLRAGSS
jgi:hypothetical protein